MLYCIVFYYYFQDMYKDRVENDRWNVFEIPTLLSCEKYDSAKNWVRENSKYTSHLFYFEIIKRVEISKLSLYYIRSILVFSTNFLFKSHLKWLFFVVNISHMPLKIWTDWKRSFAIFAFVRLFPCVSSKMACKIGRSGKHFPAKSTTVFLLWAITMIRYWLH